ncbi:flagellar basal body P-ring formation chaperone FlgA [Roseicyclus mahoneyensis]|uniref:Flagella basal body P-ring formation protein FlgA n=1 Tax=Roseicyclus mahoneyensis TaxID=164332 RepID=A0A316GHE4_9RHOB|nr:flagellar basal body P-ring formation chaperone FlgA [Roseicyclus mahoneyensis]PWK60371.1 flagella basal body P-ring formation protein FlgA [Roseicyclus mahoneyensis]
MSLRLTRALAFGVLLCLPLPARADPGDGVSGAEAQALVAAAMQAARVPGQARIAAARPLPACAHWPEVGPSTPGDWRTVDLRCTAPVWVRTLRTGAPVPASTDPGVEETEPPATGPGLVLRESLARGAVIAAEDLAPAPAGTGSTAGQVTDPDTVVGRRLAVNLAAGRVILARHLEQHWLIAEGTAVAIASGGSGISVTTAGQALQNGQRGDRITVRNAGSGRVIEAIVTGPDSVAVRPNMN